MSSKTKICPGMIITMVLMVLVVCLEFFRLYQVQNILEVQNISGYSVIDINIILMILGHVMIIAFAYATYIKKDMKILGIGLLSVWGLRNIIPLVDRIYQGVQLVMDSTQVVSTVYLIYSILTTLIFAFIIIISIYFLASKQEQSTKKITIVYGVAFILLILSTIFYSISGISQDLTFGVLFKNTVISSFYMLVDTLKYLIVVLIVKLRKSGYYVLLSYLIYVYIVFVPVIITGLLNINTMFAFLMSLIPIIVNTYVLVVGIMIVAKGLKEAEEETYL